MPRLDDISPWTVTISGLVARPESLDLETLRALPQVRRTIDIHCVTRWSKPGVLFEGVPLAALLAHCGGPLPQARFVSFVARSHRNHSTSLTCEDAAALDVLVAFAADGAPLPTEHGGPVRTVCPGRYFYKSLKWLERIEWLADDVPGFWEATAGYHNRADPWAEERYAAPNLDPRVLASALASRNFSGLDLRGADLRGRRLRGLQAVGARLRDTRFEGADLGGADFSGANLSNAHFDHADLSGARFVDADVEGAAFDGATLVGTDFTGASLFGATGL